MDNETDVLADIQAWKRFCNGDRNAFSDLFRKYYKPFLNYGCKLIPQRDLVKDSIQELFLSIWERRGRLSEVDNVRSYLYASFRRTVFRQAEIQETRNRRDRSYSEKSFEELVSQEELMILKEIELEQREQLKEVLKRLSARQREVVFLKFYNGLSNSEIAEVMGINKQSVYNHMHRAIETLGDFFSVHVK